MVRNVKFALLAGACFMIGASAPLVGTSTPADAKLHCKNVSKRFQVCGDVKPWTRFVAGFGVRFNKQGRKLRAR